MTRMPQVTARELVRFLKAHGFDEDRQSGSLRLKVIQPFAFCSLWSRRGNVQNTGIVRFRNPSKSGTVN